MYETTILRIYLNKLLWQSPHRKIFENYPAKSRETLDLDSVSLLSFRLPLHRVQLHLNSAQ